MKKLCFLVILGILFIPTFTKKVSASSLNDVSKPLVVKVNSNIKDYLTYDNYVIVQNDINIHQSGIYNVTYRNVETLEEVKKQVHVIDDEKYVFEHTKFSSEISTNSYGYVDAVVHNGELYTCYYYISGISTYKDFYLLKDNLSINVRRNSFVKLNETKSSGQNIYTIGRTLNVYDHDTNIFYFDFNKKDSFEIVSPGFEEGTCIAESEQYIFIGGFLNETSTLIDGTKDSMDSFLIVINKNNNQIVYKKLFNETGEDKFKAMEVYDNYLYILQECENNTFNLLKVDYFCNTIKKVSYKLDYGYRNADLRLINNELYLSYEYFDYSIQDDTIKISKLDKELQETKIFEKSLTNNMLIDYEIVEDKVIILTRNKYQPNIFNYLVYQDQVLINNYEGFNRVMVVGMKGNNLIFIDGKNILVKKIYDLNKDEFNNVIKEGEVVDNVINNYHLTMNNKNMIYSDKSNLTLKDDLFGNYFIDYYFEDDFSYLETVEINYLPYVGVQDNKEYDLGVTINGNANVYINDKKVELPYTFNTVGDYKIVLEGTDDVEVELNIKVLEKTKNNKKENNEKVVLNQNNNDLTNILDVNFTQRTVQNKKSNSFLYLYLVPIITLGIGGLFIKRG